MQALEAVKEWSGQEAIITTRMTRPDQREDRCGLVSLDNCIPSSKKEILISGEPEKKNGLNVSLSLHASFEAVKEWSEPGSYHNNSHDQTRERSTVTTASPHQIMNRKRVLQYLTHLDCRCRILKLLVVWFVIFVI
ncbi:hypothetical protein SKAU_G00344680 [Synaphobranchus kaupii]|uniref:Uncharacterized protein n=1 Tax=Synaphobranchus kaupii TaxID=118154 RepID=A0A9Q1EJD9_SYNKA|nr:hypothetical protein SKAU_G00344680 [Synaphobranchus kaupii]